MFDIPNLSWDIYLNGVTDADIQSYIDDNGLTPETLSNPSVAANVETAKQTAAASGNTKLENTLKFVLKYGDQALSILTKNGIIVNKNLAQNQTGSTATTDTTSNAPSATNRVFNIDFTDPKVLIITALLVMILVYFLFFNSAKKSKKR